LVGVIKDWMSQNARYNCENDWFSIHRWRILKAIPLQAWTGPEGSRSLRLPDFKTIGT